MRSGERRVLARALAVCLIGAGIALPAAVRADDPPKKVPDPPADAEFLEFLGSVGSEDEGWINYLSQTDRADASRVAAVKPPPPPPANGTKKNDNSQNQ